MKGAKKKLVAQTINLSDPKTCRRLAQVQKVMRAEIAELYPSLIRRTSMTFWKPWPVANKICLRKDAQPTRPTKQQKCPQRPPPNTAVNRLPAVGFFLAKSTIVGVLLYWTYTEGNVPFFPKVDEINIPRMENIKYAAIQCYNRAVVKVMGIVVGIPMRTYRKISGTLFPCNEVDLRKSHGNIYDTKDDEI